MNKQTKTLSPQETQALFNRLVREHITGQFAGSLIRALKPIVANILVANHGMTRQDAEQSAENVGVAIRSVINLLYAPSGQADKLSREPEVLKNKAIYKLH